MMILQEESVPYRQRIAFFATFIFLEYYRSDRVLGERESEEKGADDAPAAAAVIVTGDAPGDWP